MIRFNLRSLAKLAAANLAISCLAGSQPNEKVDLSGFPAIKLSNGQVELMVYLPDPENGLYRIC